MADEKTPAPPEFDREVVFHYSREHRLARASPAVRALNEGGSRKVSFIGSLTANRPLSILFFTIVIFMVFGFILTMLSGREGAVKIGGNTLTSSAMIYDGSVILALKKTYKSEDGLYTGAVDIAVSPLQTEESGDPEIWTHRLFFTLKNGEEFRVAVPFEAPDLFILLQTEKERVSFRVKPK
ncbi:hypothetical protein AGMMS49928_22340 [Spirochaetia bacterium]|nr:hypothetical protein AGMMS49928_22340 [Spirochaetia bacterium]